MLGSFWFLGLACIVSLIVAVAGLFVVRRKVSLETLMDHHDVAGSMLSIVGTLYAVVLGLVVVASLTKFEQARAVVGHEANSLRDIFSLSSGLPDSLSRMMRQHCIDYATTVLGEEWALMENGDHSQKADMLIEDLSRDLVHFRPISDGESNLQQSLLNQVNELDDCRAMRTVLASPPFDPIIWSVLIAGGVVLVVFTYFFGVANFRMQALMTVLVTLVLSLNMVIIAMFAYPFSGDVRVWPVAFKTVLKAFRQEVGPHATAPANRT